MNSSARAFSSAMPCLLPRPCLSSVVLAIASCSAMAVKRRRASSGSGPPSPSSSSSASSSSSSLSSPASLAASSLAGTGAAASAGTLPSWGSIEPLRTSTGRPPWVVTSAREVGDGAHDFADTLFDTLGDFDFAFAGQQFHCAHFTHVHAHRVGGSAYIGLHGGECCSGFLGRGFIGVGFGQQQGVRIRSTLEYVDPHVVDHADDVFHLFRVGYILRQVVIDLRVSQVTLLTTAADQFFQTRLLLRFSGHNPLSTEGLCGLKTSRGLYPNKTPMRQLGSGLPVMHYGSAGYAVGFFPLHLTHFDGLC